MLGLGDRLQLLELLDAVMRGDAAGALGRFADLYALGADPVAVVAGPARDLPLAVAAQGDRRGGLEPGHRRAGRRAGADNGAGTVAAGAGAGLADAAQGHRRGPHGTRRRGRGRDAAAAARLRQRPALARRAGAPAAADGPAGDRAPSAAPAPPPAEPRPAPWRAAGVAAARRSRRSQPRAGRRSRPCRTARQTFAELVDSPARWRCGAAGGLAVAERAPDPLRAGPGRAALRGRASRPMSPGASARRRRASPAGAG